MQANVAHAVAIFRPMDRTEAHEDSLVGQARRGNRAAFGELYQQYARMVHGILLARVPPSEVDDLMQDVFMAALNRLDSLRYDEAFGGWLAMIARNHSVDYFRRTPKVTEITKGMFRPRPR